MAQRFVPDLDRVRLLVQAVLALAVLAGATYLGSAGVIEGESVVALYSVALGAVGAGAVGGFRGSVRANGETTQTYTDKAGGTVTTTQRQGGGS